ncbi:MAG: hypothetical protein KC423_13580 [Anaerolineales bacterium]|nr:hypothetical protein [Anaerolineales bacterium]
MNQDIYHYESDGRYDEANQDHYQQFMVGWNVATGKTQHSGAPVTAMGMNQLTWRNTGYRAAKTIMFSGLDVTAADSRRIFESLRDGIGLPIE